MRRLALAVTTAVLAGALDASVWAGTFVRMAKMDKLHGKRGHDKLSGHGGHDLLVGRSGADLLSRGAACDTERQRDVERQVSPRLMRGLRAADPLDVLVRSVTIHLRPRALHARV